MNPLTGEMNDTIKVEHVFTFKMSDKWDRPMRKAVDTGLGLLSHFAESFRFIALGITAYFVMSGTARLVESFNGNSSSSLSRNMSSKNSPSKEKSRDKSSEDKP
jgi:hypothetical protein